MKTDTAQMVRVIDFWLKAARADGLKGRSVVDAMDVTTKEIIDIVGPRRSGKSSALKLIIRRLKIESGFLYINFEDPFFIENRGPGVIGELIETYREYFDRNLKYLFFDEVHVVEQWERAVRKLRDEGQYRIYITGSSSKLLSGEIATLLTGRHLSHEVMPLSFPEYLAFEGVDVSSRKDVVLKEKKLLKAFGAYLSIGGFPAIVTTGDLALLKQYFSDIIQKDIVARHAVREKGVLERMGVFLMTNAAKTVSIESLKRAFNISYKMASSFVDYFKEAFLFFDLPQFSYSLKKQERALRKLYAVDCGLASQVSFRFSEDRGRIFENGVFLNLRLKHKEMYYYKTKRGHEVDFYVPGRDAALIQAVWSLKDEKTRAREVRALIEAMEETKLKESLILTHDEEGEIASNGRRIFIRPAFAWLLKDGGIMV